MKRTLIKFIVVTVGCTLLVVMFNLTATHHIASPSTPFQRLVKSSASQNDSRQSASNTSQIHPDTSGLDSVEQHITKLITIELTINKESSSQVEQTGSLTPHRFKLTSVTNPDQAQRIMELAEESGFFVNPTSLHTNAATSNDSANAAVLPPSAIGAMSISSSSGVYKREFSTAELQDNPAAQNMIRLVQIYADPES